MSEQETHAEIIAEMRFHAQLNIDAEKDKPEYGILTAEGRIAQNYADRLEAAYKREVDALKQRINELDAEVAAKDKVIKRLNDAIAEEQRRKMATAEKSSVAGDCAKLREALSMIVYACASFHESIENGLDGHYEAIHRYDSAVNDFLRRVDTAKAALAAPPRNCDVGTADERTHKFIEKWEKAHEESIDGKTIIYLSSFSRWLQLPCESEETSCVNIGGNDKVHAAVSIMGRESPNKQCWECANCKEPTAGWDGSKFRCSFLGKDFGTWHYDVPNECPCKGKGWKPEKKEGGNDADK